MAADIGQVKSILETKDLLLLAQQGRLERIIAQLGPRFADALARIVDAGAIDAPTILAALREIGYTQRIVAELGMFNELFRLGIELKDALGITVVLSAQAEAQLSAYVVGFESKMINRFGQQLAEDMLQFGIESRLAQRTHQQVVQGATERLAPLGRVAVTEVNTAMAAFDRAVMDSYYQEAGFDLMIYEGPLDDVTRDVCRAALSSPNQATGWSREDIESFDGVDLITGGGFNCRHTWLPFEVVKASQVA